MRQPIDAEVCCMESQQKRLSRNTAKFREGPSQRGVHRVPAILHARPLFANAVLVSCLLYTSPSPRDGLLSRMPSSA